MNRTKAVCYAAITIAVCMLILLLAIVAEPTTLPNNRIDAIYGQHR